ncbi:MAG: lipoyl(octanoyl) transferase LipB [Bacteroidales bacterium]|jgi:lipoyl(octanoyl) transferase|nr:lipoyl(octanoyl) transferase LipB [Bacteroidales bacterium]
MSSVHKNVRFTDLGHLDYMASWDLQEKICASLVEARITGRFDAVSHHLMFVEHPHVYTLGLNGNSGNLLMEPEFLQKIGASYYKTNRGGDITYHGPGQLVAYPILNIEAFAKGIRDYIFMLEAAVIKFLKTYQIDAGRLSGATGVWLEPETSRARKICAIGVRASRGISMHGFAFNVNTDLNYFNYINPCGFTDKGVTSLAKELGFELPMDVVKSKLKEAIGEVFEMNFSQDVFIE